MWSYGVILFIMLSGKPPFYANDMDQMFENIKVGDFKFRPPYWNPITSEAKAMISRMLVVDPHKRATIDELLRDDWLVRRRFRRAGTCAPPSSQCAPAT